MFIRFLKRAVPQPQVSCGEERVDEASTRNKKKRMTESRKNECTSSQSNEETEPPLSARVYGWSCALLYRSAFFFFFFFAFFLFFFWFCF